jgi:hypothetical protein
MGWLVLGLRPAGARRTKWLKRGMCATRSRTVLRAMLMAEVRPTVAAVDEAKGELLERTRLPHRPADRGDGEAGDGAAPRASGRLAVLVQVLRILGVEFVDLPRADPLVVDVPPHRRVEVAHDEPDLHRLDEDGLARRAIAGLVHAHLPPVSVARWDRTRMVGAWARLLSFIGKLGKSPDDRAFCARLSSGCIVTVSVQPLSPDVA